MIVGIWPWLGLLLASPAAAVAEPPPTSPTAAQVHAEVALIRQDYVNRSPSFDAAARARAG